MMKYPLSSKNFITGKRKIKYSHEFVERLSFLDKYLKEDIMKKEMKDEMHDEVISFKEESDDLQEIFLEETLPTDSNSCLDGADQNSENNGLNFFCCKFAEYLILIDYYF